MITIDSSFPQMTAASGETLTVRRLGNSLVVAYYVGGDEASAVLQFDQVRAWNYGYPNDEGLDAHPLWGTGLEVYSFHVTPRAQHGERCWIATFHDGTLTVYADEVEVLLESFAGSPPDAIDSVLGSGENQVLP